MTGESQESSRDGILVRNQQEPRNLIAPEEELAERGFVDGEAQGEDARSVAAQERFDLAVETLGAVARQHEESRNASAPPHTGLAIDLLQSLLLAGERVLGALQAANDSAGGERTLQGSFESRRDFDTGHVQDALRPQGSCPQRELAGQTRSPGLVLDRFRKAQRLHGVRRLPNVLAQQGSRYSAG